MTLREFFVDCLSIDSCERRVEENEYIELVLPREAVERYLSSLQIAFGLAVKPEGKRPSWRLRWLAKEYGGIRKNQTLFLKDFPEERFLAMLWPWQDGEYATLKLIMAGR